MLDLHSPQANEFIDELMLDAFMTYDNKDPEGTGTGHVLAATYIQSKLSDSNGIFYTAIGKSETVNRHDNTYNFWRNIMADLINSVKKAIFTGEYPDFEEDIEENEDLKYTKKQKRKKRSHGI